MLALSISLYLCYLILNIVFNLVDGPTDTFTIKLKPLAVTSFFIWSSFIPEFIDLKVKIRLYFVKLSKNKPECFSGKLVF